MADVAKPSPSNKLKRIKKRKTSSASATLDYPIKRTRKPKPQSLSPVAKNSKPSIIEATDMGQYPILQNEELIKKFLNVPMSNNQKGRIRQAVKDSLQGTSNVIVPSIIHNKIQDILQNNADLTEAQLRRIRILYNLLKTSLASAETASKDSVNKEKVKPNKAEKDVGDGEGTDKNIGKETDKKSVKDKLKRPKGPKRYVVFLGNLPLDITKERIINHFSEMNEHIMDVRIPKIKDKDKKKKAIAYVELTNEPSYEFALSKHHSMLGNKRISVLYTTQKNGKITKADAKSKSAKLIALQKSGKLVGSVPLKKKRSQRRLKLKQARAKEM